MVESDIDPAVPLTRCAGSTRTIRGVSCRVAPRLVEQLNQRRASRRPPNERPIGRDQRHAQAFRDREVKTIGQSSAVLQGREWPRPRCPPSSAAEGSGPLRRRGTRRAACLHVCGSLRLTEPLLINADATSMRASSGQSARPPRQAGPCRTAPTPGRNHFTTLASTTIIRTDRVPRGSAAPIGEPRTSRAARRSARRAR